MTSFAFTLGVVPLYIATGAGSEMRVALGTAVFYGMLGVTLFGLIFTPVFYVVIRGIFGGAVKRHPAIEETGEGPLGPAVAKDEPHPVGALPLILVLLPMGEGTRSQPLSRRPLSHRERDRVRGNARREEST